MYLWRGKLNYLSDRAVGAELSNWKTGYRHLWLRPVEVATGVSVGLFGTGVEIPLTGWLAPNAPVACCPSGVSPNCVDNFWYVD
jgi:hypothetical protein